jgi:cyclic 2,3-diphosphoglycerate synthetase
MGRGGPDHAELIEGDKVALTTRDLLALAARGVHASSDCYEDAVMSRVTTVGSRRCGGGMAGATFFGNVEDGAELADSLGKELLIAEGSGAAIPPVVADATLLVVGAAQGAGYVTDFFGPYRLGRADAVIVAGAEPPFASGEGIAATIAAIRELAPGIPVAAITFRPHPIESVAGKRVFFATTAPERILPELVAHLEAEQGCEVVGASAHLSDRVRLRADMLAAPVYDVLLTELKAAAVDVVAAAGAEAGVPTVLCDNVPVQVSGDDFATMIDSLAGAAAARGAARRQRP